MTKTDIEWLEYEKDVQLMLARIPCFGCKHDGKGLTEYCKFCVESEEESYTGFSPKTNADRIRSMSDKELARFISLDDEHDYDGILRWLQQEVE